MADQFSMSSAGPSIVDPHTGQRVTFSAVNQSVNPNNPHTLQKLMQQAGIWDGFTTMDRGTALSSLKERSYGAPESVTDWNRLNGYTTGSSRDGYQVTDYLVDPTGKMVGQETNYDRESLNSGDYAKMAAVVAAGYGMGAGFEALGANAAGAAAGGSSMAETVALMEANGLTAAEIATATGGNVAGFTAADVAAVGAGSGAGAGAAAFPVSAGGAVTEASLAGSGNVAAAGGGTATGTGTTASTSIPAASGNAAGLTAAGQAVTPAISNVAQVGSAIGGGMDWTSLIGPGLNFFGSLMNSNAVGDAADQQANAYRDAAAIQAVQRAPWIAAGTKALDQLSTGLAPGGQYNKTFTMADAQNSDAMKVALKYGKEGVENSAAARSGLLNSNAMKQGIATAEDISTQYQNQAFNQFMTQNNQQLNAMQSLANVGQTNVNAVADSASNAAVATGGANTASTVGQTKIWSDFLSNTANDVQTINTLKSIFGNTDSTPASANTGGGSSISYANAGLSDPNSAPRFSLAGGF